MTRNSIREDEEDAADARRILGEVASGKQKLLSKKAFEKKTGTKI